MDNAFYRHGIKINQKLIARSARALNMLYTGRINECQSFSNIQLGGGGVNSVDCQGYTGKFKESVLLFSVFKEIIQKISHKNMKRQFYCNVLSVNFAKGTLCKT